MPEDVQAPYTLIITCGEPETDLWCPSCLLPSVVRAPLTLIGESGTSDAGTVTRTRSTTLRAGLPDSSRSVGARPPQLPAFPHPILLAATQRPVPL